MRVRYRSVPFYDAEASSRHTKCRRLMTGHHESDGGCRVAPFILATQHGRDSHQREAMRLKRPGDERRERCAAVSFLSGRIA